MNDVLLLVLQQWALKNKRSMSQGKSKYLSRIAGLLRFREQCTWADQWFPRKRE